jgi:cytochrome c556
MRSLNPHLVKVGIVTLCALASVPAAYAQAQDAETKAVATRQAVLKLIDWNFAPVGEMLRNKAKWDAAVVQKAAGRVESLAPMIPEAFMVDTHARQGITTKARENIWTNQADFKAKADELVKAAQNLGSVAKSGADDKALRTAAIAVGKACSNCHDNYKDK